MKVWLNWEYEDEASEEPRELSVMCSVSKGSPGKYYGDSENCYPAEPPEVEIIRVEYQGVEMGEEQWRTLGLDEDLIYDEACRRADEASEPLEVDDI